ncbi:MAG TPA: hypothetical protein DCM31_04640 [Deferribacteraceae bacterium]|nr:hypothetical protein [Deferribacteraceae bacterium]
MRTAFLKFNFLTPAGAIFSQCRKYRYVLWRNWGVEKKRVVFIGLNPSTADEKIDDPTVRRCITYAKNWGFSGMFMLNIFAFRSTNPKLMKAEPDPVGVDNDFWLEKICSTPEAQLVIAKWGNHGVHNKRSEAIKRLLPQLSCLGVTNAGEPKHILYLPYGLEPTLYHKRGQS